MNPLVEICQKYERRIDLLGGDGMMALFYYDEVTPCDDDWWLRAFHVTGIKSPYSVDKSELILCDIDEQERRYQKMWD